MSGYYEKWQQALEEASKWHKIVVNLETIVARQEQHIAKKEEERQKREKEWEEHYEKLNTQCNKTVDKLLNENEKHVEMINLQRKTVSNLKSENESYRITCSKQREQLFKLTRPKGMHGDAQGEHSCPDPARRVPKSSPLNPSHLHTETNPLSPPARDVPYQVDWDTLAAAMVFLSLRFREEIPYDRAAMEIDAFLQRCRNERIIKEWKIDEGIIKLKTVDQVRCKGCDRAFELMGFCAVCREPKRTEQKEGKIVQGGYAIDLDDAFKLARAYRGNLVWFIDLLLKNNAIYIVRREITLDAPETLSNALVEVHTRLKAVERNQAPHTIAEISNRVLDIQRMLGAMYKEFKANGGGENDEAN